MSEQRTFDDFIDWMKESADRVGEQFVSPEDDWLPTMFAVDRRGHMSVGGILGVEPKHYPRILKEFGNTAHAQWMGVILSTWAATLTLEERVALGPDYRIEDDPVRRREVLLIGAGDAAHEVWWEAPIIRSKLTVALGIWQPRDASGGRQVGALQAACKR